jgi:hypothetical protein
MVVLDELALLIAYAFGGQRAASEGDPLNELIEAFALFVADWISRRNSTSERYSSRKLVRTA